MPALAQAAAVIAAIIHVWFFWLESLRFDRPEVWRRFGVPTPGAAAAVRPMAFNQGFYNLFLAIGIAAGLGLVATGAPEAGRAIVLFACASMLGAAAVLYTSNRRFLVGAAIQGVPPLLAILLTALLRG